MVSRGSAPSWSSAVAHTCACTRSRSAQAGGARVGALAAGFGGEHRVGGEHQLTADPVAEAGERSGDGEQPVEPDLTVDQRRAHRGEHRRQRLAQDRLGDRHRLRGTLQPTQRMPERAG